MKNLRDLCVLRGGMLFSALLVSLLCMLPAFSHAGQATDMAADPVLEKRMIGLAENLRCLVCQNESLASSHADLAEDLRREVREQMQKGLSDQEIIDYLVSRYGDFVLYDPPVKKATLVLWYGPFALLLAGAGMLIYQLRKRKSQIPEAVLSAEDAQRAASLLDETPDSSDQSNGQGGDHARSLSPASDATTSHSTRSSKSDDQVAGYPPKGESDDVSLREAHTKDKQA